MNLKFIRMCIEGTVDAHQACLSFDTKSKISPSPLWWQCEAGCKTAAPPSQKWLVLIENFIEIAVEAY